MSIYKYVSANILKKILNGSIRFTQPGAFNDPFELLPEIDIPEPTEDKELRLRFDLTSNRREIEDYDLKPDYESDNCNDVTSRRLVKSFNLTIGILCLTRNPKSLTMWSHYADEYRGAVVEFNEDHKFFKGLIDIEYCNNRPKRKIEWYINSNEPIPISELCVKSKEWINEEEVRIIRSLSDCKNIGRKLNGFQIFVLDLPLETIKSITMGERMKIENQRFIWDTIKDTNISLNLAAIANHGYEFRQEPVKTDQTYDESGPYISPRTAHIFKKCGGQLGEAARWMANRHPLADIVNETA